MIRRLAAILLALLAPSAAFAQSCNFNISSVVFTNVDTLSSADTDITATIAVSCTGLPLTTIRICPSIGAGSGGATSSARQMIAGASTLNYQLYQNAGRTVVWGSYNWALPGTPPTIDLAAGTQRHREHQSHDLRSRFWRPGNGAAGNLHNVVLGRRHRFRLWDARHPSMPEHRRVAAARPSHLHRQRHRAQQLQGDGNRHRLWQPGIADGKHRSNRYCIRDLYRRDNLQCRTG